MAIQGYLRSDGRKGIRNYIVVAYLVECAHHVAREIVLPYREQGVQLIGFPGCYPNAYAMRMMSRAELVGAEQALAWGLADAVISDGANGNDFAAFTKPLNACAPQVLRGIKAQAIVARQGAGWKAHRAVEQKHLVRTWLHDDHWAASEKLLSKGS